MKNKKINELKCCSCGKVKHIFAVGVVFKGNETQMCLGCFIKATFTLIKLIIKLKLTHSTSNNYFIARQEFISKKNKGDKQNEKI